MAYKVLYRLDFILFVVLIEIIKLTTNVLFRYIESTITLILVKAERVYSSVSFAYKSTFILSGYRSSLKGDFLSVCNLLWELLGILGIVFALTLLAALKTLNDIWHIKSNRKRFRVCIAWYKHEGGWENSRQSCQPETTSRVCITGSNSPNPSSVYIKLCKDRKKVFYCFYKITFLRKNAKLSVMVLIKRESLTSLKVLYTKSCSRTQFLFCKKMLSKIAKKSCHSLFVKIFQVSADEGMGK